MGRLLVTHYVQRELLIVFIKVNVILRVMTVNTVALVKVIDFIRLNENTEDIEWFWHRLIVENEELFKASEEDFKVTVSHKEFYFKAAYDFFELPLKKATHAFNIRLTDSVLFCSHTFVEFFLDFLWGFFDLVVLSFNELFLSILLK